MKKLKKGFTIVELVIVIAVIAILAAVLIPVFSNVVDKANKSKDTQLVRNLNTALASDLDEHNTMYDALQAAKEYGYDVEKINASATDNEILWDSKNDCFVYLNDGDYEYIPNSKQVEVENLYDYWIISSTPSTTYSTYYTGSATDITVSTGFDAGEKTGVNVNVVTNDAKDLIIRANSVADTYKITAPNANIKFYGTAGEVNVEAVKDESLHIYGAVEFLQVTAGRVVAEDTAVVKGIHVAAATAKVEIEDNAVVEVVTKQTGLDNVTVEGYTETIEAVDAETAKAGAKLFAAGNGTQALPFIIETVDQLQNINEVSDAYNYFIVAENTVFEMSSWSSIILNGSFDGNGATINNLDAGLFSNAYGDAVVIKNFTINANIISAGGVSAVLGKSNTLNLTIENVDVHGSIIGADWVSPYVNFGPGATATWNVTFKNCVSDATLVATSGNASGFVGHPYNKVSQGDKTDASLITIIDSAFVGNMSATGTSTTNNFNFKYFTINGNNNRVKTIYSESFIEELGFDPEGTLYDVPKNPTTNSSENSKTFFAGNYGENVVDYYMVSFKKALLNKDTQSVLPANVGDVFEIIKVSGATKAIISLQVAPNDANNYGSYLGTYMTEELDISAVKAGEKFNSEEVKYFTININADVTDATGVSGNIFNIVNSNYGLNAHNGASIRIVQMDANNNVLNITTVVIANPHLAE